MTSFARTLTALLLVALAGCPGDPPASDAGIDAAPAAPPPPGQALTTTSGRLTSATYTLDVQVGHGLDQRPAAGATHHLEPSTVIKP